MYCRDNPVHRKNRVEIVSRHDQSPIGVLEWRSKTAAHHITQDIENNDISVVKQMMFLEELDGLTNNVAAATRARRRPSRLDTKDAVIALANKILDA